MGIPGREKVIKSLFERLFLVQDGSIAIATFLRLRPPYMAVLTEKEWPFSHIFACFFANSNHIRGGAWDI
jgi:hypothetical protein